jgi:hypothetical protein
VFDDSHILRTKAGAQACQIIVEDDVEYPMQPVLYAPMAADGACEGISIELGRAEIVTGLALGLAAPVRSCC